VIAAFRPSEISFRLAKHLLYRDFRDEDGFPGSICSRRSSASASAGSTKVTL